MLFGVQRGLEWIAGPGRVHHPLALNDRLVDVDLAVAGIGRTGVALLVAAHAHDASPAPADIARGQHHVDQRRLDQVVVVAPDDALLIGVHRARAVSGCLGLVGPFGRLPQLGHRNAGDPAAFVERQLVGCGRGIEITRIRGDEVLVVPALVDHIGEQPIEQRDVGSGLDVEMQARCPCRRPLRDRDGRRAPRIDEDDLGLGERLAWEHLLLLRERAALQVRAANARGSSWSASRRSCSRSP